MSLHVPRSILSQVSTEAEKAFPEECCGFLIGPAPEGFELLGRAVRVDEARPLPNAWEEGARTHRYQIDPKIMARAEKNLSGTGRGIVGFYHSHPEVPPWPSPFDLERAWPCYSYWIVSVRGGRADGARSWMRSEDGLSFIEEEIVIE